MKGRCRRPYALRMSCRLLSTALILCGTLSAPRVRASSDAEPSWYGWQTAGADGLAVALTVIGLFPASNDQQVAVVAIGGTAIYLFAAPVIHLAHDNRRGAIRSVVTRAALPIAGGLLVGLPLYALRSCSDQSGGESQHTCATRREMGALVGGVVVAAGGVVAASIMDAMWFARSEPTTTSAWHVTPSIGQGHLGLVLSGTL